MQVRALHHVALAVADLEQAVATYERLFDASVEVRERLDEQGVEAVYLRVGEARVELLSALSADTTVGRFLAKRGPGMHHLGFEVDDAAATHDELAERGALLIDEAPRRGLGGHEVFFLHPDGLHGVLAEMVGTGA